MKREILLMVCLLTVVFSLAQTQRGIVKTKGRLNNNNVVIHGTRLQGATVQLKGHNAVLSQKDGGFSFPIPAKDHTFFLQKVEKLGYVLTDPDILQNQYAYSSNPLVLVMETPAQQAEDKFAAIQRITRTLQRQLQEKQDEIEKQKQENKLTTEKYREELQKLFAKQVDDVNLTNEMAEHYSKIDFDNIDPFHEKLSKLILTGMLKEADSLINTKGDLNLRADSLRQLKETIVQAEQQIKKMQKRLNNMKSIAQKKQKEFAQDCYGKYDIFRLRHQNDSAVYYIKLRADQDTLNMEWQIDAGKYMRLFTADMEESEKYYNRALRNASSAANSQNVTAKCYEELGNLYITRGDYRKGIEFIEMALAINRELFGERSAAAALNLCDIGNGHFQLTDFQRSKEYYERALAIQMDVLGEKHEDTANTINNIAMMCSKMGNYNKAIELYQKSLTIIQDVAGKDDWKVANCQNNLSMLYLRLRDYEKSYEYANKALELQKKLFHEKHYYTAKSYMNIGGIFQEQGKFQEALQHFKKALEIFLYIYGENSDDVSYCYHNIGSTYCNLKDYTTAIDYLQKALSVRVELYGEEHGSVGASYNNIGYVYDVQGDKDKALELYGKALAIRRAVYGEKHPLVSATYSNIGSVYEEQKDYSRALDYYLKAESALTEDSNRMARIKRRIEKMRSIISKD